MWGRENSEPVVGFGPQLARCAMRCRASAAERIEERPGWIRSSAVVACFIMLISRNSFEALCREQGDACISVYMPTHRRGSEIDQDPIRLKNLISETHDRLAERAVDREALSTSLDEMERLVDDRPFWRHQGEGLALFGSERGLQSYRLSTPVAELTYVGRRHCVRPLLPAVSDGGMFHILALSQNSVRLLQCGWESVREVDSHDIPDSLAEALGYDWEQKSLQFHTGAQPVGAGRSPRAAVFHGHGSGSDAEGKEEIERFLRRVDEGITQLLEGDSSPLVVAAVDFESALYRDISRHPNVLERAVVGNPDHRSAVELHAAALPLVEPHLTAAARRARARLAEAAHSSNVVHGIAGTLGAADAGRVDTLFVSPEEPVWGRFDGESGQVDAHPDRQTGDDDLLDLAIARAIETGAEVLPAEREGMPGREPIAALLRY